MNRLWVYIGVIGSGKDFSAKSKKEETRGEIESFSEGVREFTWEFLGWKPKTPEEYEQFKYQKFNVPVPNSEISCDGRKFLENIGSKMRKVNKDFWANYAKLKCAKLFSSGVKDVIIYDCRYLNEARIALELQKEIGCEVHFTFCNYGSHRKEIRNDESEYFAQHFLKLGYKDGDDLFSEIVKMINDEETI